MSMTAGRTIIVERTRYQINQYKLALELGWYRTTLIDVEADRVGITNEQLAEILAKCKELGEQQAA